MIVNHDLPSGVGKSVEAFGQWIMDIHLHDGRTWRSYETLLLVTARRARNVLCGLDDVLCWRWKRC